MTTTVDVAVVGAGVAGLVVAHDLARAGASVIVLESHAEVGGLLRRGTLASPDGATVSIDVGAESFATRTSAVEDLIDDAGLALDVAPPAPQGAHIAAVSAEAPDGVVRAPLPRRTVLGIPADPAADDVVRILGAAAARRVAAEPTLPPVHRDAEEPTLAALVAERCGAELVARLVDPLTRSVYSQPADRVRLSRLHPALWAELHARGSLLAAVDALATATRTGSAVSGVVGGMWRLPAALRTAAEAAGARVRTGVPVRAVVAASRPGGAVVLDLGSSTVRARQAVVATGTRAAAALLDPSAAPAETAPVRVVAALVRSAGLDAHPVGSGVIVAADVPSAAKALTHVTAKWPWMSQDAGHVVRLSARDAAAPGLDTADEIAREITLLTGVPMRPDDILATTASVWRDAVAAAPVAADRRRALASAGIHLAGATVAGTGLASVVPHARALAADLLSTLATTGSTV